MPLIGDPTFLASFPNPISFARWVTKDLVTLDSLQKDGVFCSFMALQESFSLPSTEFYKYLQIRHFFNTQYPEGAPLPVSAFEDICGSASRDRGTISLLYNFLGGLGLPEKSTAILNWEAETGGLLLHKNGQTGSLTCTNALNIWRRRKRW